ncbi:MAG TPA: FtsX-like permease family protein [Gemmatimonadales bacterium]|nr:FtsX-like permease family protein [Gemmatimonadales bacterium]
MGGARFVLRHAGRELRAARRRLGLLVAAVSVGVAALVAVDSFTDNLRASVRAQARDLLGADIALTGRQAFTPRVTELLARSVRRADLARVTRFAAMAYVPRTSGARLVQAAAVEGRYPFYGRIVTEPAGAWDALQQGRGVVVDPELLAALDARVGDTLALGEGRFVIAGELRSMPGDVGARAALGPRVFLPARDLPATKLLGFGARAEYATYVRAPAGADVQRLAADWRARLQGERIRVRTVGDDQRRLDDSLGRLGRYLGLVALVALLLGGLGVASAVHVFLKQQQETIAVLRCLGAGSGHLLAAYLIEAGLLGLGGSALGVVLGVAAQQALPGLLRDFLPVAVEPALSGRAALTGLGMGLWTTLAFALPPLLAVRRIPPLAALRRAYESERERAARDPWRWAAFALLALTVPALAVLQVGDLRTGLWFAAGIGAALGVLALASWALVRGMRRWFPHRAPYVWRQGLANLYRPANQTVAVVLALGFGAFLLGTLVVAQHGLLAELDLGGPAARPNLVLFDIQTDQRAAVDSTLAARGLTASAPVPIVPMRIRSIRGRAVTELLGRDGGTAGRREGSNAWALRREYRSTYRDTLVASEQLVAGTWWSRDHLPPSRRPAVPPVPPVPISVESGLARELGVGVGDEIVWDVQGLEVPSRVASLRDVDWARFEPNFFVVFAPGALEQAPQTWVVLTRAADPAVRGALQRALAERLPNITVLDLASIAAALEHLVGQVVLAIRFMALFSLLTGALVLVGAVSTSRLQRRREAVLLRTLGATRRQIGRIVVAEYLALGALAALVGLGLATAAGWALARFVFDTRLAVPVAGLLALGAGVVALTLLVGVAGSREVARRTPLEALREG